jgi:hypothetical protein
MTQPDESRPTIDDVDPEAMAVNSVDDQTRLHADADETEVVESGGEVRQVSDHEPSD